mgnify:CR=1 FL=1
METTGSKLTDLSDTDLVRLALEQNQAAFIVLYTRYNAGVKSHISRYVIQKEDVEDICLESFQKAFSQLASYNPEYRFSTWIYRIATNEVLNHLRKFKVSSQMSHENAHDILERKIDDDVHFNGNELQRELHKAIQRLPQKQRIVFNLRYFDEMKYEEISEITGTSTGALKASYHHAYNRIRKELEAIF